MFLFQIVLFISFFTLHTQQVDSLQDFLSKVETARADSEKKIAAKEQEWTQRISAVVTFSSGIAADQKAFFDKNIPSIQTTIHSVLSKTRDQLVSSSATAKMTIQELIAQVQSKKLTLSQGLSQANIAIAQAQSSAGQVYTAMVNAIEPSVITIENTVQKIRAQQQTQYNLAQAQQAEQAYLQYRDKMSSLVQALGAIMSDLDASAKEARDQLLSFIHKGVDSKAQEKMTRTYEIILGRLSSAYRSLAFSINFIDKSNVVANTLRSLIWYYLQDCAITQTHSLQALKRGDRPAYHILLYALSQRIMGASQGTSSLARQGYGAVVNDFATRFLTINKEAAVDFYEQTKNKAVISLYPDALQDLVSTVTAPTQQHISYATAYYNVLMGAIAPLAPEQKSSLNVLINTNVGILYGLYGQQTVKNINLQSDNNQVLNDVINSYQQAAVYFGQAHDNANAQRYTALYTSLQQAVSARSQAVTAQRNGDIDSAIRLYQQAYQYFLLGGDSIDAQSVSNIFKQLQGDQLVKQAQQALQRFIATHTLQFIGYMSYISNVEQVNAQQLSSYDALYTSLDTLLKELHDLYVQVLSKYQEINYPTGFIEQSIAALNLAMAGSGLRAQADIAAASGTSEALVRAQNYYAQAHAFYTKLDAQINQNDRLKSFIFYPGLVVDDQVALLLRPTQRWDYTTLLERHIARHYIEIASRLSQNIIMAVQYYSNADGNRNNYLSTAVETYLTVTLQSIAQVQSTIDMVIKDALQQEDSLMRMPSTAWAAQPDATIYSSVPNTQWQNVVHKYLIGLRAGNIVARADYMRAMKEYAQQYNAHVPVQFYPTIGAASLYYNLYVLAIDAQDEQGKASLGSIITNLLQQSMVSIRSSLENIQKADFLLSATTLVGEIVNWMHYMDAAIIDQQTSIAQLGVNNAEKYIIIRSSLDTQGATLYTVQVGGQQMLSIQVPSIEGTLAALYAQLGNTYFAQQNYIASYQAYHNAQRLYEKLKNTVLASQAKSNYDIAYTRATATFFKQSIIPNSSDAHGIKSIVVADITVPERYEFFQYNQSIPSYIPVSATLQELVKNPTSDAIKGAQMSLLRYAYLLFVDNALRDYGISYENVFSGVQKLDTPLVSQDEQDIVKKVEAQAYIFEQGLQARITSGLSFLQIQGVNDGRGSTTFYLIERYKPISVLPLAGVAPTGIPYTSFPTVDSYYNAAQTLSDPAQSVVQIGPKTYVSGNDKPFMLEMIKMRAQAFLSAGQLYKKRVDYIKNNTSFTDPTQTLEEINQLDQAKATVAQIRSINKNDMSIAMQPFMDSYNVIKQYLYDISFVYYDQAQALYDKAQMPNNVKAIQTLKADTLALLANIGQLFLVGDPRSIDYFWGSQGTYGGLLWDLRTYYLYAAGVYQSLGKSPDTITPFFTQAAQLFVQAGDLLSAQKLYYPSLTYYGMALGAYKSMPVGNLSLTTQTIIKWLASCYTGALNSFAPYRNAMMGPVIITTSSGQQESVTLQELIAQTITGDPDQVAALHKLRNSFLDSLIYFRTCASAIDLFSKQEAVASNDSIAKEGMDVIATFTQKKGIGIKTYDDVFQWIVRADFEQTMIDFLTLCESYLTSQDQHKRLVGYSALTQWCLIVHYQVLSVIYVHDFNQSITDLQQAMQFEQNEILAPAEQWIGTT